MLYNFEAPTGGWNAFNSLDDMPPNDAVEMVNLFPDAGYVRSRGGSRVFAGNTLDVNGKPTSLGFNFKTLIPYQGTGGEALLAAGDGDIYDITAGGDVSGTGFGKAYSNDRWQYVYHGDSVWMVNGEDQPQRFNGSTLVDATYTLAAGETATLDPTKFVQVNNFKGRLFYIEDGKAGFWYCQAGSAQGEMRWFDLSRVAQRGGEVSFMVTWTKDGGEGMDDLAAFVFNTGETLIYQGDDPEDLLAWSQNGRFTLGQPIGRRAYAQVGGDIIILTRDGYLNLSAALTEARYSENSLYSIKIVNAAKIAAAKQGDTDGWEATLYSRGNMFIVNVPVGAGRYHQHVRNTNTGAWTRFEGWDATTWGVWQDKLYFADVNGRVMQGDVGTSDDGDFIDFEAVPAFQHPSGRQHRVQVTAAEVVSNYNYPNYVTLEGLSDYDNPTLAPVVSPPEGVGATWDEGDWDETSWALDETRTTRGWQSIMANGYAVTFNMRFRSRAQSVFWYSSNMLLKAGGDI